MTNQHHAPVFILLADKARAVEMWNRGHDTASIASALNFPEATIYNDLPKWRKAHLIRKTREYMGAA